MNLDLFYPDKKIHFIFTWVNLWSLKIMNEPVRTFFPPTSRIKNSMKLVWVMQTMIVFTLIRWAIRKGNRCDMVVCAGHDCIMYLVYHIRWSTVHLRIGEWQTSIYTCLKVKIVGTSFRSGYVGKTNNKDHFIHNFSMKGVVQSYLFENEWALHENLQSY